MTFLYFCDYEGRFLILNVLSMAMSLRPISGGIGTVVLPFEPIAQMFFSLLPSLYLMIFFKLERGSPGEQVGFEVVVVVVGFLSPVEDTLLRHRKGSTWLLR